MSVSVNEIKHKLLEEIHRDFPSLLSSLEPYLESMPICRSMAAGQDDSQSSDKDELCEGYERLGLAQYLHNQPGLKDRIIAGDYYYASGIAALAEASGPAAVVGACKAMCRSISGYYRCLEEGCSDKESLREAAALTNLALAECNQIETVTGKKQANKSRLAESITAVVLDSLLRQNNQREDETVKSFKAGISEALDAWQRQEAANAEG